MNIIKKLKKDIIIYIVPFSIKITRAGFYICNPLIQLSKEFEWDWPTCPLGIKKAPLLKIEVDNSNLHLQVLARAACQITNAENGQKS